MVAYSLDVGGLGDLLRSLPLSDPTRGESCTNEFCVEVQHLLSMYRVW